MTEGTARDEVMQLRAKGAVRHSDLVSSCREREPGCPGPPHRADDRPPGSGTVNVPLGWQFVGAPARYVFMANMPERRHEIVRHFR